MPPSTIRFTQLVQRAGRPHVHALWTDPDDDAEFVRARKAHRVLTLEHAARGKAESGYVGFDAKHRRGSQFLVFPKPLASFDGARVVGVKFDLIDQPDPLSANERQTWQPRRRPLKDRAKHVVGITPEPARASNPSKPLQHHTEEAMPTKRRRTTKRGHASAAKEPQVDRHRRLLDEVRAALDEMRRGQSVAAYERLRAAVERESE